MITETEELKFAVADANQRLAAQYDLIKFNDQQMMTLLGQYTALGVAGVGLALTYVSDDPLVSGSVAMGLASASASLAVAAIYAFRSIESGEIKLPGRGFDFWQHIVRTDGFSFEDALRIYINDAIEPQKRLREMNERSQRKASIARRVGAFAPIVAAVVGVGSEIASRLL